MGSKVGRSVKNEMEIYTEWSSCGLIEVLLWNFPGDNEGTKPQNCSCPLLDSKYTTSDAIWVTTPVRPSYYACWKAVEACNVITHHVTFYTCIPFSGTFCQAWSLILVLWKMKLMGAVKVAQHLHVLRQISKSIPCWFFLNYLFPSTRPVQKVSDVIFFHGN